MNPRVSFRKGLALSDFWERLTKLPTPLPTLALPLPDVLHGADHAIVKVDIAGALIKVIDALLTDAAAIDRAVALVGRPTPRLHQFLPRLPHHEEAPRRSAAVLGPAILGGGGGNSSRALLVPTAHWFFWKDTLPSVATHLNCASAAAGAAKSSRAGYLTGAG